MVPADDPRRVVQGLTGQRQRSTVEQHGEAPGGDGTFLVDRFIYQGLPRAQRRRAALRSDRAGQQFDADEPIRR
jgi:hypothetical protein